MSSSKAAVSVADTQINLKYNSVDGGAKILQIEMILGVQELLDYI